MTKHIGLKTMNQGMALATGTLALTPLVIEGLEEFKGSFDRLCLQVGTSAIEAMLAADAEQLCGKRYQRHADRQGHRWGMIGSEIGWHGGKAAIRRQRVRHRGGAELELPSWTAIQKADLICPDRRSEGFHSSESVQHPAFYRYRESYPRRNGSPRNCCSRAGDERSAVPVCV